MKTVKIELTLLEIVALLCVLTEAKAPPLETLRKILLEQVRKEWA